MNHKKYSLILYIIISTVALTIAIQVYWNYKNYEINTQRYKNEVQISLDNAVENYYANLAKENNFAFVEIQSDSIGHNTKQSSEITFDTTFLKSTLDGIDRQFNNDTVYHKKNIRGFTQIIDSNSGITFINDTMKRVTIVRGKKETDSLRLIKGITSIYISLNRDSLDFEKLNLMIKKELRRKNISIAYTLTHYNNDVETNRFQAATFAGDPFKTLAKSTYLKSDEKLEMIFPNETKVILKRGVLGILLSSILAIAIIASLFFLLHIIKKQKALAEIKNDLISNITHEFKTPITTISTAVEAMNSFNILNDSAKTKEYLSISDHQLKKLSLMVEKLLETAVLDSDKLMLQKEPIDIVWLIEECVKKQEFVNEQKHISFSSNVKTLFIDIDAFHFENAIANLIDNAIKYGGNSIEVSVNVVLDILEIKVADNNQNSIDKNQRNKIFDKFYRIPKGNTHDVKGFGIGLYYTKKIIEKHGGVISLGSDTKNTVFKIKIQA